MTEAQIETALDAILADEDFLPSPDVQAMYDLPEWHKEDRRNGVEYPSLGELVRKAEAADRLGLEHPARQ